MGGGFGVKAQTAAANAKTAVRYSRDHGKSGDSAEATTYEKMTGDQAALLDRLQTGPVNVLGWSDGGIEALLLAMPHPAKVKKIAVMAANLNPSAEALHPDGVKLIHEMLQQMSGAL